MSDKIIITPKNLVFIDDDNNERQYEFDTEEERDGIYSKILIGETEGHNFIWVKGDLLNIQYIKAIIKVG